MAKSKLTASKGKSKYDLLAIGGSAGSLVFLLKLIPLLKKADIAVVVVLHRKTSEDNTLIEILTERTDWLVKEAEDKDEIHPGVIFLAPADYHMLIEKDGSITLDDSERINYSRPSIDVTFECAAEVYGSRLVCLLLSGANADGVAGLKKAVAAGALVAVQDPASAEVPFMPMKAVNEVDIDFIVNENNLKGFVESLG